MFIIIWSLDFVLYNKGQNAQFGDRICFLLQMRKCWVARTNMVLVFRGKHNSIHNVNLDLLAKRR